MTTDLDRLIEAVEAEEPVSARAATLAFPRKGYAHVVNAAAGSIDAAVALLEALLPGWSWGRLVSHGTMLVCIQTGQFRQFSADSDSPARALLLATLRAYRSTREGG